MGIFRSVFWVVVVLVTAFSCSHQEQKQFELKLNELITSPGGYCSIDSTICLTIEHIDGLLQFVYTDSTGSLTIKPLIEISTYQKYYVLIDESGVVWVYSSDVGLFTIHINQNEYSVSAFIINDNQQVHEVPQKIFEKLPASVKANKTRCCKFTSIDSVKIPIDTANYFLFERHVPAGYVQLFPSTDIDSVTLFIAGVRMFSGDITTQMVTQETPVTVMIPDEVGFIMDGRKIPLFISIYKGLEETCIQENVSFSAFYRCLGLSFSLVDTNECPVVIAEWSEGLRF